jgi:hypothetical protein
MFIRTAGGDPRDLLGNPHIGDLRSAVRGALEIVRHLLVAMRCSSAAAAI